MAKEKFSRKKFLLRMNNLFDTLSDTQLMYIQSLIVPVLADEQFQGLYEPESKNFTQNGLLSMVEDVSEGNWGTLYRSPEN